MLAESRPAYMARSLQRVCAFVKVGATPASGRMSGTPRGSTVGVATPGFAPPHHSKTQGVPLVRIFKFGRFCIIMHYIDSRLSMSG